MTPLMPANPAKSAPSDALERENGGDPSAECNDDPQFTQLEMIPKRQEDINRAAERRNDVRLYGKAGTRRKPKKPPRKWAIP